MKVFHRFSINDFSAKGLVLNRGDDHFCKLIVQGNNLAGTTIRFMAKRSISDLDAVAVISKASADMVVVITNNTLEATFEIAGIESSSLPDLSTTLLYGVQLNINGKIKTLEEDVLTFQPDVIRGT